MRYPLLFALTFISLVASAQHKHLTSFGFKGGINWSVVNGHDTFGQKTGFIGIEAYAAFFADTELNAKWKFESELLFSYTDEYIFIEIPLHWKYQVVDKTYILLGPKLDMVVSSEDQYYNFKNFGASIELGGQYEFTPRIFAEARYSLGLVKQINDYGLDILDGKRNTLRLGLGIRF